MAAIDLIGKRFGRLLVIARAQNTPQGRAAWLCACECGGQKIARAENLGRGDTTSCGCRQLESRKTNGEKAGKRVQHQFSRSALYRERKAWENMKARCTNPAHVSYQAYGAAGVTVCREWMESFEAFARSMGPCPDGFTLERCDRALPYSPGNCEWASRKIQANNRGNNRLLTAFDRTQTVAQWAEELGVPYAFLYYRTVQLGMPLEQVIGHR